jgi:hypothetical protein
LDRSKFGDGPPAIHYFLNSFFSITLNFYVLNRLTPKAFEFTKNFSKLPSKITFLLLEERFLGLAQISFEKWQAATGPFSKEFCENLECLSSNKKKRMKIQKTKVNSLPVL